ncbi:MAG TPA: hypothetical protein VM600_05945, partial [Actinomycetota bacterium]|nr:hypothetical protein [Actinomycetota bacterium]
MTSDAGFGARAVSPNCAWVAFEEMNDVYVVRLYNARTGRTRNLRTAVGATVWLDKDTLLLSRIDTCSDCHSPQQVGTIGMDLDGTISEVPSIEWLYDASAWVRHFVPTDPEDTVSPE